MMSRFCGVCTVCGGRDFVNSPVLWPELINAWQLSAPEIAYINRQQGFHCANCKNNLRALALAAAIMVYSNFNGALVEFCADANDLKMLEINRAANLTVFLQKILGHRLIEYPDFDMQNLAIPSNTYDVVIHSDTLEHIPDPVRGLIECKRVLKPGGRCIFTIPVIVDRMSRSRTGLAPSYHGQSAVAATDQVVHTEFGVDMWKTVLLAGFDSCKIFAFEYPAALVLIAEKN